MACCGHKHSIPEFPQYYVMNHHSVSMNQECWNDFKARIASIKVVTNNPVLLLSDEFVLRQQKVQAQERINHRSCTSARRRHALQMIQGPFHSGSDLLYGTEPKRHLNKVVSTKPSRRLSMVSLAHGKRSRRCQTSPRIYSSAASKSDDKLPFDDDGDMNLNLIVRRGSDPLVDWVASQRRCQACRRRSISFMDLSSPDCEEFPPKGAQERRSFSLDSSHLTLDHVFDCSSGVIHAPYDLSEVA